MIIYFTNSTPGTVISCFPLTSSLADWSSAKVQLTEGSSPNTGRWSGTLTDGQWSIFEGSSQPASFNLSIGTLTVESPSTGSGPRTVTITVTLSGDPLEGADVSITNGATVHYGTTDSDGEVVFNTTDGTWTVAITADGASFAGAILVVNGNEAESYTMTATAVSASDPGKRTGYLVCYDENGAVEENVSVTVTCYYSPNTGLALDSAPRTETSDGDGLVQFPNLIIGAKYRVKRGSQPEYKFEVASGSGAFEIVSIVGKED